MAKGKTKRGSLKSFAAAVQYIENNKVSNIIMAIALVLFGWQTVKNNERVILVPPNMAEEMVIANNNANAATKKYWADWFVGLVGNINPNSRDLIVDDVKRILAPSLHFKFEENIDRHIETLRLQEVQEIFIVKDSDYIAEADIVWVYGDKEELSRKDGRSDPMPHTYEVKVNVLNGSPVIESYTVYPGAPQISKRITEINQSSLKANQAEVLAAPTKLESNEDE